MSTKKSKTTKTKGTTSETSESEAVVSPPGGPLKPDEKRGSAQKGRRTKNRPRKAAPAKTRATTAQSERALTFKETRFVEHYLATGNATESARQAGYSSRSNEGLWKQGSELLRKPPIARAIRAGAESSAEALLTTRASRVRWLLGVRDGSITMTQAMPTGEGIATITTETPPRERLKAAEILARMNGDLLEKVLTSNSLADLVDSIPEDAP